MATYGSVSGVSALVPVVGTLDGSSVPNSVQVTAWLEQGYAIINRVLTGAGYSAPVSSSAAVYGELAALNNQFAAAHVIRARGLDTVQGTSEDRSVIWLEEFRQQLSDLAASDLSGAGVSLASTTSSGRRRIRSTQLRRVDGYSGTYEGDYSDLYDYTSE